MMNFDLDPDKQRHALSLARLQEKHPELFISPKDHHAIVNGYASEVNTLKKESKESLNSYADRIKKIADKKKANKKPITQAEKDYIIKMKKTPPQGQRMTIRPKKEPLMDLQEAKKKVFHVLKTKIGHQGKSYQWDKFNREIFNRLTRYFTQQENEQGDYPLDKGIWLFGDVGRGKTFITEVFEQFTIQESLNTLFTCHNMKVIAQRVQQDGIGALFPYYQGFACYDDVGFENRVKQFGNEIDCFSEIINEQYKRFTKSGKICIVTTNLTPDQIFFRYGERIEDRCKEMFSFIFLDGKTKRHDQPREDRTDRKGN